MTTYAIRVGGLGNQLFQLAAARALDPDGDGRLVLGTPNGQTAVEELAPALAPALGADELQRVASVPADLRCSQPLGELPAAFVPRPTFNRRPVVLKGYFQHPDWYTDSLASMVDDLLAAAPPDIAQRVLAGGRSVVSVRGSDYLSLDRHLAPGYYVAAMNAISPEAATVASEDLDRAQIIAGVLSVIGWNVAPPSAASAVDDFWSIAVAPMVVMANSTFCWWATQVGDELYRRLGRPRTVVAPAEWIRGHGRELLAREWIAID